MDKASPEVSRRKKGWQPVVEPDLGFPMRRRSAADGGSDDFDGDLEGGEIRWEGGRLRREIVLFSKEVGLLIDTKTHIDPRVENKSNPTIDIKPRYFDII